MSVVDCQNADPSPVRERRSYSAEALGAKCHEDANGECIVISLNILCCRISNCI